MPTDRPHPLFARLWTLAMRHAQPAQLLEHRRALVAGLHGRVVEVGAGSGTMLPLYPAEVTEVIAVEPEPYLRRQAASAAADAAADVRVVAGDAEALPAEDGSVDAVVFALVLCSVPDQAAALAEARRVLRSGGELRYYEHVAEEPGSRGRRLQQLVDRSGLWRRAGGGCHVARETGAAIRRAGFSVASEDELRLGARIAPVSRHLLGRAT